MKRLIGVAALAFAIVACSNGADEVNPEVRAGQEQQVVDRTLEYVAILGDVLEGNAKMPDTLPQFLPDCRSNLADSLNLAQSEIDNGNAAVETVIPIDFRDIDFTDVSVDDVIVSNDGTQASIFLLGEDLRVFYDEGQDDWFFGC